MGGFTLLELLLVLTLVALLSGLAAPRVWQWVGSARMRADIDTARTALEALPRSAFSSARRVTLGDGAVAPWPLPAGWRVELSSPLSWDANGMTAGGRLRLVVDGKPVADWVIEAPAGTVRDANSADGPFAQATPP